MEYILLFFTMFKDTVQLVQNNKDNNREERKLFGTLKTLFVVGWWKKVSRWHSKREFLWNYDDELEVVIVIMLKTIKKLV